MTKLRIKKILLKFKAFVADFGYFLLIGTFGEEEWSSDWIYDWLYDECCRSCSKADNCEQNVFRCGKVLDQIFKRGDKHDT